MARRYRRQASPTPGRPAAGKVPMPTMVAPDADIRDRVRATGRRMVARTDESGRLILTGTGAQTLFEALTGEDREPWRTCGAWAGVQTPGAVEDPYGANDKNGPADRAAAFHLGYYGWPDALEHARALFRTVTAQHTNSLLREPAAMDEPGDVDVAAYLGDADLQFLGQQASRSTAYGPGSVVRFEHDMFTSAGVNTSDMAARGLVVVAAAYMLERAGLRTEITARLYANASYNGKGFDIRVAVKPVHEPLVLSRILYWLAHPSALRIILHQIGTLHGNGRGGYHHDYNKPKAPGVIQTPGQALGTELQEWLRATLTQCGLRVRS